MRVRKLEQRRGVPFVFAESIIRPTLLAMSWHTWIDGEKIPATGGCLVVLNHISHIDPLLSGHFVYDHGRLPRYLAKSSLFSTRALGGLLTAAGQIPVGQWGAQDILPPYTKTPRLWPRKHVTMKAGDPLDLADLVAQEHTADVIAKATDRIMAAITALVADLRGEPAPKQRFDPRVHGVRETGNPNDDARGPRRKRSR